MLDTIFSTAFEAAYSAIFEVGAIMAILMLVFGILDYKKGDQLRDFIIRRKLDRPFLMTLLALIPVDGTLLFQYSTYRKKGLRPGSLLAGMIGIGEESTYLIISYNPLAWLMIAGFKLIIGTVMGSSVNKIDDRKNFSENWHAKDHIISEDSKAIEADENFHELPDKFRHKFHHMRYHMLGKWFWIMFLVAFVIQIVLKVSAIVLSKPIESWQAMNIPLISWLAMSGIVVVFLYRLMSKLMTKEFGKIFEHEFEDAGDAVGDLAEICSGVILTIFSLTFLINLVIGIVGNERLSQLLSGRGLLAVAAAALIGLIPGTGASLAFTTLYFSLAGSGGALPFAALLTCSLALVGDSLIIGKKQIGYSQKRLHLITVITAFVIGLIALLIELNI